ncbi:hypothetical protein [Chelativorans sp. M5D2P16]|uniref:hypothetical protein n=1 Tax=Chelativorans sp. M5D2P16 TaxID=3095678 RepID=UPI002ACA4A5E|nr:hypothetical protein [Chelativorans sp. M5D2P16]MDZ5699557.1 hypothetical protein [Chelativorans sp. M5D2P16]
MGAGQSHSDLDPTALTGMHGIKAKAGSLGAPAGDLFEVVHEAEKKLGGTDRESADRLSPRFDAKR